MALSRQEMEARYRIFDRFALKDQKAYYEGTATKYRLAARQVNKLRALSALGTGLFAAGTGFIVQSTFVTGGRCAIPEAADPDCGTIQIIINVLMVLAVVMPALGAFFGTLADLYQWDRLVEIYDTALKNVEVTDAHSPDPEMDDKVYSDYLRVYAEGTLSVMQDETAQWGQSARAPDQINAFLIQQGRLAHQYGGNADAADKAARAAARRIIADAAKADQDDNGEPA